MNARFKFSLLLVIVAIPFNFIFSQELKEKKFQSVLLINGHAASSTIGFGGKYSGSYSLNKFPDYALGINLSCEKITGFIKFLIPKNVGTEITLGTLGCHASYKINSQLFIQPEFSVLIGR